VVDAVARICGICPIAYELGASYAMEDACGITVGGQLAKLRRLIYYGEWIESHILHMAMLHAPDFLGYEDAIQMAKDHPEVVKDSLRLKKIGNDIMIILGGREIHPINLKVGGFYKVPAKKELRVLIPDLKWGIENTINFINVAKTFPYPDFTQDYEYIALTRDDEYAIVEGDLISNKGWKVPVSKYDEMLKETHVEHSTSLHTHTKDGNNCFVGPLARYNLNYDKLTPLCKEVAEKSGLGKRCYNPFKSILIRGIEMLYSFEKALEIVENYEMPDTPSVKVEPRKGTGYGCTEAPRGICYHRYTIDGNGIIEDAKIVSPTAVNQPTIEKDLWNYIIPNIDLPDEKLQWECEQAIRIMTHVFHVHAIFLSLL